MNIVKLVFNPIQENTYILWDETLECIIIDAGNASAGEDSHLAEFIANMYISGSINAKAKFESYSNEEDE